MRIEGFRAGVVMGEHSPCASRMEETLTPCPRSRPDRLCLLRVHKGEDAFVRLLPLSSARERG